jgi:hypothetical protein
MLYYILQHRQKFNTGCPKSNSEISRTDIKKNAKRIQEINILF